MINCEYPGCSKLAFTELENEKIQYVCFAHFEKYCKNRDKMDLFNEKLKQEYKREYKFIKNGED